MLDSIVVFSEDLVRWAMALTTPGKEGRGGDYDRDGGRGGAESSFEQRQCRLTNPSAAPSIHTGHHHHHHQQRHVVDTESM